MYVCMYDWLIDWRVDWLLDLSTSGTQSAACGACFPRGMAGEWMGSVGERAWDSVTTCGWCGAARWSLAISGWTTSSRTALAAGWQAVCLPWKLRVSRQQSGVESGEWREWRESTRSKVILSKVTVRQPLLKTVAARYHQSLVNFPPLRIRLSARMKKKSHM